MKKTNVIVPWHQGLHLKPATRLIHTAKRYRSAIRLKAHGKVADARSIIHILLLCATFGTLLEVEVSGEDEIVAASAIEQLFKSGSECEDAPAPAIEIDDDRFD